MTQRVYTRRLGVVALSASGTFADFFTVPAGHVYVVQTLMGENGSTTLPVQWRLRQVPDMSGTFYRELTPAGAGILQRDLRLASEVGETLRCFCDTTPGGGNTLRIAAFGYDLLDA